MYNFIIKKNRNKKIIAIIMIALLIAVGWLIWYREQGTNREIPKKATYVLNLTKRGGEYK